MVGGGDDQPVQNNASRREKAVMYDDGVTITGHYYTNGENLFMKPMKRVVAENYIYVTVCVAYGKQQ